MFLGGAPHPGYTSAEQINEGYADVCIVGNKMVIVVIATEKYTESGCIHRCTELLNSFHFLRVGCQTLARDNVAQKAELLAQKFTFSMYSL